MKRFVIGRRPDFLGCLFTVGVSLAGCGSLPDLKEFSEATGDIHEGMMMAGADFAAWIPNETRCGNAPCLVKFEAAWQPRIEAVGAIADYSDALAQIAAAGDAGAATADRVMQSANGLLVALNVPALPAVSEAAVQALGELVKYKALRSLDEAIEAAHGPIAAVAESLQKDLSDMSAAIEETELGVVALVEAKDEDQVGSSVNFARVALVKHRGLLRSDHRRMADLAVALAEVRNGGQASNSTCASEDDCGRKLHALDTRVAENRVRLVSMEGDLQRLEQAYAPLRANKDAVAVRAEKMRRAIIHLRVGLQQWVAVHKRLGENVRRGLKPNVRQLMATATELKHVLDELRRAS